VAQGSSLSAFAGNVLLYDLDHELNKMGVTAVRYIDDIFMLSESAEALELAVQHATSTLTNFGFSLYKPVPGSPKASQGLCKDAFTFLGCTIQPNRCVPSTASVDKICTDVRELLSKSKRAIKALSQGSPDFNHELARSAILNRVGRKVFGWEKSFAFCTDAQPFRHVDEKMATYVLAYEEIVDRYIAPLPPQLRIRAIGIPSTEQLFGADQERMAARLARANDAQAMPSE
jgi:RNA-directed DNA polymerase